MITENLSTLKIHKLTQEQYDRELEAGRIDPSAIYLTPDDNANTGNATPDWNENDPNSPSYIQNRPFYAEYFEGYMPLVDKQTVNIDEDNGYAQLQSNMQTPFIEGSAYAVTLNGIEYECVAWNNEYGCYIIGNGNIYGGEGMGGNEPFSCDSYDSGTVYLNVETAGTYTISISGIGSGEYVHKIDEKYLPDMDFTYECGQQIEYHNNSSDSHSDIRELIDELNYLVGDTKVSEQIDEALSDFSSGKTLAEHLGEEMMVLTSLQYGDTLPDPSVPGRIFFKRVSE